MTIYDSEGRKVLDVAVDDNSYRSRAIMGDNNLTLYYSLAEHVEIPVGAYCDFENARYTLMRPEGFKMKHSRNFEYTVIFEAPEAKAKIWKFRNPVDGRLKFSLTAKPHEHLQMFVDNMNRRDSGWAIGVCIEGVERLISYDNAYCFEALQQMSEEFGTEFEIQDKTVSLHKVEYNRSNPLPLSYGRGNGFKPNVGRSNSTDGLPVEILFALGGEENIDKHAYGNASLLLPISQTIGFDGEHFSDETGYDSSRGRDYVSSADGLSIQRSDKELSSQAEDSLDCSTIYPKRVGVVGRVITVDAQNNFYVFTDANNASDPCPNYEDYLIRGETMTVRFQSGMLAGRELEVKYIHNAVTKNGVAKPARRFEIVPQEIDGITIPNDTYKPAANDTYVVFHCSLPQSYICDNASKSGASWTMFREAVKYLYEHEEQRFSFTGTLDGLWAKKDWVNIGGRIVLGGYISFTDERFQREAVLVRITGIKDYINNPHSPEITLSNETVTAGFSGTIKNIESKTEVIPEDNYRDSIQFTKRRFRDARETMKMLEASLIEGYSQSISPVAAQMLQLLVGDDSLQFRFVTRHDTATPSIVTPTFLFSPMTGRFTISGGYFMQHLTLGIDTLSPTHAASEFKWWAVPAYQSAVLDDADKRYYIYLKCARTSGGSCEYLLAETAIPRDAVAGYYHFLVGVLNSEYCGERSTTALYGFTEITGGRITTDKIVSSEGTTYWDLMQNILNLGGKLQYNTAESGAGNLLLKGTLIQTGSGEATQIGAWCGEYDGTRPYQLGDEVWYKANEVVSTYRYINSVASSGHLPSDADYWEVAASGAKGRDGKDGIDGVDGVDGLSIVWKGDLQSPPANPQKNWCYRDTDNGYVYIYNGLAWGLMTRDGTDGKDGQDGADGVDGVSIVWKGTFASHPANPRDGWAYYNSTEKKSFTYRDGAWYQMTVDGVDGVDGADGRDGADGVGVQSTAVSYNTSSSGTTVPVGGWSDVIPSVSPGFYLWTRTTISYTDGTSSTSYTAARQGANGSDGIDGADGPAMVYRGPYESGKTYVGNSIRVDVVFYDNQYYVAKSTAGEFTGTIPTNTTKWYSFGASFDSIATGLLLSEEASIANFVFRNQKMVSQTGDAGNENLQLDGVNGIIKLADLLRLDKQALTMYSDGVEKVSVRNSSVGDYDISLLKKSESISGQQSSVTVTTYLPSTGVYVNIGENKVVNKRLGHFDAGDRITVSQGVVTLSTPTANITTQFSAPTVQVCICKDGMPVSTGYIIASGSVSSGTSKRMELSGGFTYIIPSGGDGDYSVQFITKGISVKSDSGSLAVTTSFTTLLSYSFNKANFAKSLLGNDGILLTAGAGNTSNSGYLLFNANNLVVGFGNYAFKVDKTGISKSSNGGASFTTL